jgi:aminopeptidase N
MLMTMRAVVNDDRRWLATLRGLNSTFRHQTVTAKQIRDYMSKATGVDLSKVFVQYQETTKIPVLEYRFDGKKLSYRWTNVVDGFAMPVRVGVAAEGFRRVRPTSEWQSVSSRLAPGTVLRIDPAFYVMAQPAE